MHHLARWLTRYLNDPKLIIWLGQSGGRLHDVLVRLIEKELDHFMRLEQEDKAAKIELEKIRANSTNAIPDPLMRKLWHLLLTGRVKSPKYKLSLFNWNNRLKREGLTTTLRLELRELLAPKVQLKQPFHWRDGDESTDALEHQKQPVDCELVLATDHVHSLFKELDKDEHWHEALPALLDDFQKLLLDALDLLRELEQAGDRRDLSYLYLPSISPHWQNKEYYDWVVLIELLRDAWQVVRKRDFKQATKIAQDWFDVPYPTFKRLALFAASHDSCIVPDQWVDWLITDDAWWLWYGGTQRETMRLLVLQGVSLSPEMRDRLEARILVGPPRAMYREDIEPKHWRLAVDRSVWLRLAKLREGSGKLGNAAEQRFDELSNKNPEWKLKDHERDEFSHWMSGTGDPDYEAYRYIDIAPRKRRELIEWLKQPDQGPFHEDTWRETCRTRFFHSCLALCDLAKGGIWPAGRWGTALYAWGEGGRVPLRSWQFTAPLVQAMPDKDFQDIAHSVSFWMKVVSKSIEPHEEVILFDLCRRLLELPEPDDKETDDFVFQAINHSVGHVTEALLNRWFKREPNDNDGLPEDISLFFTKLCDVGVHKFRHGRVLLASQLISLFRVDRNWTEKHLLPLFTWKTDAKEAKAVWEGFLWSPHLYPPLLLALKSQFIETARHYKELGEFGSQYVILLTYAALDRIDGYGLWDYRNAIASLPQEGLEKSAQTLYQALSSSGEQRENYWKNRIHPFWQDLWPKSGDLVSPGIAEFLAQLSIAARREFPTALSIVYDWLRPIEYPVYAISQLCKSELTIRFPDHALDFLDAVIDSQSGRQLWVPHGDIRKSLEEIIAADGSLAEDPRYKQLHEYCRQHDI